MSELRFRRFSFRGLIQAKIVYVLMRNLGRLTTTMRSTDSTYEEQQTVSIREIGGGSVDVCAAVRMNDADDDETAAAASFPRSLPSTEQATQSLKLTASVSPCGRRRWRRRRCRSDGENGREGSLKVDCGGGGGGGFLEARGHSNMMSEVMGEGVGQIVTK